MWVELGAEHVAQSFQVDFLFCPFVLLLLFFESRLCFTFNFVPSCLWSVSHEKKGKKKTA